MPHVALLALDANLPAHTSHLTVALLPSLPCTAAQSRAPGGLYVRRLSKQVTKKYTAKAERKVVNVVVAINLLGGEYAKEYTGTRYAGCPPIKAYEDARGKARVSMAAEEYTDFLRDAWLYFRQQKELRRIMPSLMLVHDRSKVHQSKVVQAWLGKQKMQSMLAPPRSPDLMPLDYGVFGTIKAHLMRDAQEGMEWDERAQRFLQLLRELDVRQIIKHFPVRVEACIDAQGSHFESMLHKAKRA